MKKWSEDYNYIDPEDEKGFSVGPVIAGIVVVSIMILIGAWYYQNTLRFKGNARENVVETAENIRENTEDNGETVAEDAFAYAQNEASKEANGHDIQLLPDTTYDTAKEAADNLISGSSLVSGDLDFWHMYDRKNENNKKKDLVLEETTPEKEDPSTDGKHTLLKSADGTEEWVEIDPRVTKNRYNLQNLVYQYPEMKYYEDGSKISHVGISISEDYEDVDFDDLKAEGIDYVMLRIGYRGYGSGELINDGAFFTYYEKAKEAGLGIGGYFYSQAITEQEALEEAALVVQALQGFELDYPVAYVMEYVKNDTARVTGLSKQEKTKIAIKFMDGLKSNGIKTILYGNKEWLIRIIDLSLLSGYDIWYSEESDIPDYPYGFTMWEYTKNADLRGIDEPGHLSVCMIDYRAK